MLSVIVLVTSFGEPIFGSRVLVGARSQCCGGERWGEGRFREFCDDGSFVVVLWWLALAR